MTVITMTIRRGRTWGGETINSVFSSKAPSGSVSEEYESLAGHIHLAAGVYLHIFVGY